MVWVYICGPDTLPGTYAKIQCPDILVFNRHDMLMFLGSSERGCGNMETRVFRGVISGEKV